MVCVTNLMQQLNFIVTYIYQGIVFFFKFLLYQSVIYINGKFCVELRFQIKSKLKWCSFYKLTKRTNFVSLVKCLTIGLFQMGPWIPMLGHLYLLLFSIFLDRKSWPAWNDLYFLWILISWIPSFSAIFNLCSLFSGRTAVDGLEKAFSFWKVSMATLFAFDPESSW